MPIFEVIVSLVCLDFDAASANLPIKVRLQQAISEQSVIIVTRLLSCSRRNKRKEK
jgi:hypothetical protein